MICIIIKRLLEKISGENEDIFHPFVKPIANKAKTSKQSQPRIVEPTNNKTGCEGLCFQFIVIIFLDTKIGFNCILLVIISVSLPIGN
jgi:hypothetical protein